MLSSMGLGNLQTSQSHPHLEVTFRVAHDKPCQQLKGALLMVCIVFFVFFFFFGDFFCQNHPVHMSLLIIYNNWASLKEKQLP